MDWPITQPGWLRCPPSLAKATDAALEREVAAMTFSQQRDLEPLTRPAVAKHSDSRSAPRTERWERCDAQRGAEAAAGRSEA